MIVWHNHHIIPEHAGGTDDPSNILRCNIAMHAFMHKIRWQETGDEYDRISWLSLSGSITNAEANHLANIENGKRIANKRVADGTNPFLGPNVNNKKVANGTHPWSGPDHNNKRIAARTHPFLGGEIARKTNIKRMAEGTNSLVNMNNTIYTCPHCDKKGRGPHMFRWHFNGCKEKKND